MTLRFRPLAEPDLPRLHAWLNEPAVLRWWEGRDVSWEAVVRDHTGDTAPFEHWIALEEGSPVGWIRCYGAAEFEPETVHWTPHLELETTAGLDYLVSGDAGRGRGLGARMIRAFVDDVVFGRHPEWKRAAAGPFAANTPSLRALEKAGFARVAILDDEEGVCALMVCERDTARGALPRPP